MFRPFLQIRVLAALVAMALLAGCATTNVATDFDPTADFSKFHTYFWAGGKELDGRGVLENSLIDKHVKDIIGRQLAAKGFTEVAGEAQADVAVRYWVGLKEKTDVQSSPSMSVGMGWGGYDPFWGGRWGARYTDVVVTHYKEGTLIVDLINSKTKELAWRAYLVQTVDKNREKTIKRADDNAVAAFSQYPPTAVTK
jgi:Domain of unknown function (DUF4136)